MHANIHAWTGFNVHQLALDMGQLIWLAIEAATTQGLGINPRVAQHLLRGAEVLGMVRERPRRLDALRTPIARCLNVLVDLRQQLHPMPLADADRAMRLQLRVKGVTGGQDIWRVFLPKRQPLRKAA